MSYLVDTNIVSELRKGRRCDPGVASWFAGVSPAKVHGLTLVTRNVQDVERTGVPCLNPFEA